MTHNVLAGWISSERRACKPTVYMLSTCFGPHIFARFLAAISEEKTPHLAWVVSSRRIPDSLLDKHNEGYTVRCSGEHTL
eukprot:COSAG02_NODE_2400_length_8948_cov_6.018759_5_plen_80_part_00